MKVLQHTINPIWEHQAKPDKIVVLGKRIYYNGSFYELIRDGMMYKIYGYRQYVN
jgi:hypothetical protein